MPLYMFQGQYSGAAIKAMVENPQDREAPARALAEAMGAKLINLWFTFGSDDIIAIYEAKDFSCGLFAPDSQVVAQSEDIGSHVVPMPWTVQSAMAKLGQGLAPGDVILVNDPYVGGTHLNDVTIICPVFLGDRLIFFPAVRAHWPDVGGMVPGSSSAGSSVPPASLMERSESIDDPRNAGISSLRPIETRMQALPNAYASR